MISLDTLNLASAVTMINGQNVGTIAGSDNDRWESQTLIFDGNRLHAGTNVMSILASGHPEQSDDFTFKNIRLYHE